MSTKKEENFEFLRILDKESGLFWTVRIVKPGQKYGLNNSLVNEKTHLIEFYDCRYMHTEYGQFVSRYYYDTLLSSNRMCGICLDAGVHDWKISKETFNVIKAWISSILF